MGRILARNVFYNGTILAYRNQEIENSVAEAIIDHNLNYSLRSPLTCRYYTELCQQCYGSNLSTAEIVDLGETIGVIAAQSIGEPGTQLTMRTFHTGGVFSGSVSDEILSPVSGQVHFDQPLPGKCVITNQGQIAFLIMQKGQVGILTSEQNNSGLHTHLIDFEPLSLIFVKQGQKILRNQALAERCIPDDSTNQKQTANISTLISGQIRFDLSLNFSNVESLDGMDSSAEGSRIFRLAFKRSFQKSKFRKTLLTTRSLGPYKPGLELPNF